LCVSDACTVQGVAEKNSAKFAASHFCNHKSQSHAVLSKMSTKRLVTQQKLTSERSS